MLLLPIVDDNQDQIKKTPTVKIPLFLVVGDMTFRQIDPRLSHFIGSIQKSALKEHYFYFTYNNTTSDGKNFFSEN